MIVNSGKAACGSPLVLQNITVSKRPPQRPPQARKYFYFFGECKANHQGESFICGNITNPTILKFFPLRYRGRFFKKVEVFSLLLKQFWVCLDFLGVGGFFHSLDFSCILPRPRSPAPVPASSGHHDHRWDTWGAIGPGHSAGTAWHRAGSPVPRERFQTPRHRPGMEP